MSLMVDFQAAPIFKKGCTVDIKDLVRKEDKKSGKFKEDDGSLFVLTNFVKVPEQVPANTSNDCVTYVTRNPTCKIAPFDQMGA